MDRGRERAHLQGQTHGDMITSESVEALRGPRSRAVILEIQSTIYQQPWQIIIWSTIYSTSIQTAQNKRHERTHAVRGSQIQESTHAVLHASFGWRQRGGGGEEVG